jgi:hypothetical protein
VPPGVDVRAVGQGVNALARFEHHALSQPGITHIVVLEGINDIGNARQNPTPTAEDLIAGHKQLIEQAHARGLKIYGATLTPFYGAAYYTEVGEAKRQALNEWIRTSKAYDAVIDFDRVTRDPENPKMLLRLYDSCDHLHPNDTGLWPTPSICPYLGNKEERQPRLQRQRSVGPKCDVVEIDHQKPAIRLRSAKAVLHSQKQKLVVESAIMPKSRAEMLNDLRQLMAEYSVFQRSRPDLPQGNLLELSQDELEQLVMEFQRYKSEQRDEMIRPARVH